ncbi:hypothetical protein AJ80_07478 [Polytolypa hystricis UAMH7299]|uniref:Uncharacterized protein n=1 Tax=Polytolypa hystricis (strain UAMH7299) TaxID=1447883 RepID=A0A2B7XNM4_POLH7|nr:hypothetical protein AJ80_07478 [Polytolypa hystricis UAMH7299]
MEVSVPGALYLINIRKPHKPRNLSGIEVRTRAALLSQPGRLSPVRYRRLHHRPAGHKLFNIPSSQGQAAACPIGLALESRLLLGASDISLLPPSKDIANCIHHYFSLDCTAYFTGVTSTASSGHAGMTSALTDLLTFWRPMERRVISRGVGEGGANIFVGLRTRARILAELLESFPEMEFARFDEDGRISEYTLYIDRVPLLRALQEKRGGGVVFAE